MKNRPRTTVVQPRGVYFQPRWDGCVGSATSPIRVYEKRGVCGECLGVMVLRGDGLLRYHKRKDR